MTICGRIIFIRNSLITSGRDGIMNNESIITLHTGDGDAGDFHNGFRDRIEHHFCL